MNPQDTETFQRGDAVAKTHRKNKSTIKQSRTGKKIYIKDQVTIKDITEFTVVNASRDLVGACLSALGRTGY